MMRHDFDRTSPLWQTNRSFEVPRTLGRLDGQQQDEVVIIGGGITGAIAGLLLVRAGKSVTLIEGRAIADGETSRSTAHVTEMLDARFHHLIRRFGTEKILRFSEAHRMAIHRLGSLIEELGDVGACGWSRVPGYLFCENDSQLEALNQELAALEKLKIPSVLVKHVPLPFSVPHAIRVESQAQVDPDAALRLILGAFVDEGGKLHEHTRATEISPIRNGVRITTETGTISCEQCVVATHSPVIKPSVAHFDVSPLRTYVLAVRLKSAPLMDGLFWDMDSPYHYLRMANGQLIVGGEDHRTGKATDDGKNSISRLEDYVRSRFEVESITAAWSGQIFESVDGLPFVGPSLRSPRIHYATGYSGNGISQGTLAGILLSELVLGRTEDLARLLSPHRPIHPTDLWEYASNNIVYPFNVAASLVGRPLLERFRREEEFDPASLALGESRVGTIDGKRVASHRDEEGRIRTLSARCTHLGGEVSFNEFEKTWDCACHGSRFSLDGEVICGPAKKPLKEYIIERTGVPEDKSKRPAASPVPPRRIPRTEPRPAQTHASRRGQPHKKKPRKAA
jgi:glycine/D-amino acid oxidase-like deaminating enzyme/nitrite reductase/ring-hydroxylating ferredoxin subunit